MHAHARAIPCVHVCVIVFLYALQCDEVMHGCMRVGFHVCMYCVHACMHVCSASVAAR